MSSLAILLLILQLKNQSILEINNEFAICFLFLVSCFLFLVSCFLFVKIPIAEAANCNTTCKMSSYRPTGGIWSDVCLTETCTTTCCGTRFLCEVIAVTEEDAGCFQVE